MRHPSGLLSQPEEGRPSAKLNFPELALPALRELPRLRGGKTGGTNMGVKMFRVGGYDPLHLP